MRHIVGNIDKMDLLCVPLVRGKGHKVGGRWTWEQDIENYARMGLRCRMLLFVGGGRDGAMYLSRGCQSDIDAHVFRFFRFDGPYVA
mgnify:CR=1 FL=1